MDIRPSDENQFFNILKEFSALHNVMMPAIIAGKEYSSSESQAKILLTQLGLQNRLNHYPHELSGGELQRVGIARALINDPAIILADEPTGNLDKESAKNVAEILDNLNKNGKTLIVASHDQNILKNATIQWNTVKLKMFKSKNTIKTKAILIFMSKSSN